MWAGTLEHLHHRLDSLEVKPNVFIINKSAQDQTVKDKPPQRKSPRVPCDLGPPLVPLSFLLVTFHLPSQARGN